MKKISKTKMILEAAIVIDAGVMAGGVARGHGVFADQQFRTPRPG